MESLALSYSAGKALDLFVSKMKEGVIERWGKYRAQRFVEAFTSEVEKELREGNRSENLDELLNRFVEDEDASQALFDAYRRVVISKSKDVGPCVIGILKAQLLIEEREPTWEEERMFTVAEELSDEKLVEFSNFIFNNKPENESDNPRIEVEIKNETVEDRGRRQSEIDLSSPDLDAYFGSWGVELRRLGVLKEREFEEEKAYHVGDDRYKCKERTWSVLIPRSYIRFARIVKRVKEA